MGHRTEVGKAISFAASLAKWRKSASCAILQRVWDIAGTPRYRRIFLTLTPYCWASIQGGRGGPSLQATPPGPRIVEEVTMSRIRMLGASAVALMIGVGGASAADIY